MSRIEELEKRCAELEAEVARLNEALRLKFNDVLAERDRLRFALECIRAGETASPAAMADADLTPEKTP